MKKSSLLITIAIIMIVTLIACSPSSTPTTTPTATNPTIQPTSTGISPVATTTAPTTQPTTPVQTINLVASTGFSDQYYFISDYFKPVLQDIEQKSNGRIKFTQYLSGQLFSLAEELKAVNSGAIDFAPNLLPQYYTGDCPWFGPDKVVFLFDNRDHFYKAFDNGINAIYAKKLESMGAVLIPGSRHSASGMEGPGATIKIRVPADIKGMKIRTSSVWEQKMVEAAGAAGVTMTISDVYLSLQRNIVQGMISNPDSIRVYKIYEVTTGFNNLNSGVSTQISIMNKKRWGSLTPDLQKIITDVCTQYANSESAGFLDAENRALDTMKKAKPDWDVYTANPTERQQWVDLAAKYVWPEYVRVGGIDADEIIRIAQATRGS